MNWIFSCKDYLVKHLLLTFIIINTQDMDLLSMIIIHGFVVWLFFCAV